jgi:uncharacterized protein (DUF58 family)
VLYAPASNRPRTVDQLIGPATAAAIDRLDVVSRKVFSGKLPGERRSKRRGRSVEFDDYREYIPGDDLRHIDWNVMARLDRLFIKLFREEEDLALHLLVDASPSMDAGEPNKLIYAHRLAMALGYIGLVNQNRVSCAVFGNLAIGSKTTPGIARLAPLRGRRSTQKLADFLLQSLNPETSMGSRAGEPMAASLPMADSLRKLATTPTRGVTVLISDMLVPEGVERTMDMLAASGMPGACDLCCVQLLSPAELDPSVDAQHGLRGDLRLTDVESGAVAEVTVSRALLKRYAERLERYTQDLRDACFARGIAFFRVSTATPVETLLADTLRRGGLLR